MINDTFKSYLSGLSATDNIDYLVWKTTRHMKRPRVRVPLIRKEDDTQTRSEQEKTKIYARRLRRVFQSNDIDSELDMSTTQCNTCTN